MESQITPIASDIIFASAPYLTHLHLLPHTHSQTRLPLPLPPPTLSFPCLHTFSTNYFASGLAVDIFLPHSSNLRNLSLGIIIASVVETLLDAVTVPLHSFSLPLDTPGLGEVLAEMLLECLNGVALKDLKVISLAVRGDELGGIPRGSALLEVLQAREVVLR